MNISLTAKEINALRLCISGELENDDGNGHDDYMAALRRISKKLKP